MRLLGVLLCYNDADVLPDVLERLLEQEHDVVVWDHGSSDRTPDVLARYKAHLLEVTRIDRSVDFYDLYPMMSRHLMAHYTPRYDWVSWPDQDECLEGPDRTRPYQDWLREAAEASYDWIRFTNFNFWFTEADDPGLTRPTSRIRHYAPFHDCAPRIRSWRASATNLRVFNHNRPEGREWPVRGALRHYPMRSEAQALRRVHHDRAGLRRGRQNHHYEHMSQDVGRLRIAPGHLHVDTGAPCLDDEAVFDWRMIYGYAPAPDV